MLVLMIVVITTLVTTRSFADSANGMVRIKSAHSVTTTIDKLETALLNGGMTVFKRISHSDGAAKAGFKLRETELLIFGNPKIGTLLMQCQQTTAIDLPMKALAYKDESGQVWLAYNDPQHIADRHHTKNCEQVISKMTKALGNFSVVATQ